MERINPTIKGVVALVWGLCLSFCYSVSVSGFVFLLCFSLSLLFCKNKKALFYFMCVTVLTASSLFFTAVIFPSNSPSQASVSATNFAVAVQSFGSIYSGLQLSTRIMAFASMGMLFAFTTNSKEFVNSLIHQAKLPIKYAYGVLSALHLSSNIKQEFEKSKLAFQVRGIGSGFLGYRALFAMLVNSLNWSASVAMAMESKGFDGNAKRTFKSVPKIKSYDISFLIVACVLLIILVVSSCYLP